MKLSRMYSVFVLAAISSGCASDDWHGTVSSTSLRVDKVSSVDWIPSTNGVAGAKIEIDYERPVDGDLARFVDRQIAKTYMDACGEKIAGPGVDAVQEAFKSRYLSDEGEMNCQLKCSGQFVWFNSTFATYRTTLFTYFGGVHSDVWYGNATYDRRTNRRITLADLFDETNIVSVVNVIRRKIAADESRSEYLREKCSNDVSGVAADFLGKCDGGDPKVIENFMLVGDGIVWTYNEYEISSYSEGATDVLVSWDEIGPYLREYAPTPMTIPMGGWDAAIEGAKKNGDFKNGGREYHPSGQAPKVEVYDFVNENGRATPYGVYDIAANDGFVNVGISHDTAEFAVDSIRRWWRLMGSKKYPRAERLFITADGGGSNGSRNRLWKIEIQKFANEIGKPIYVSHFPPGTSKWNKIEHRLFSFISMNWRGKPLETLAVIVSLIGATRNKSGLKVKAVASRKKYRTGEKVSDEQLAEVNLEWQLPDAADEMRKWNYIVRPQISTTRNGR